jgi:hypothetical protein
VSETHQGPVEMADPPELTEFEQQMLKAARTGEVLSPTLPLKSIGVITIRAEVLHDLLVTERWQVHPKGVRLQYVRITGRLDFEWETLRCPLHLDSCVLDPDQPVVLNNATASLLSLTHCGMAGLEAEALVATSRLDLSGTRFSGPVHLVSAEIAGHFTMTDAILRGKGEDGVALHADRLKVGGNMSLNSSSREKSFSTAGAVSLFLADITGHLSMVGAQLNGDKEGTALNANRLRVGGDAILKSAPDAGVFSAAGAVSLFGADITGNLDMTGAKLSKAPAEASDKDERSLALHADRLKVGGDMYLSSSPEEGVLCAAGAVSLFGADITGHLSMVGAQLNGKDKEGTALNASEIKVGGHLLLHSFDRCVFTAEGAVRLFRAGISGDLRMTGARLNGNDRDGVALQAGRIKVGGVILLDSSPDMGVFSAAGAVSLFGADITGSLVLRGAELNAEAGQTALDAPGIRARRLTWGPRSPVHGQVNLEGGSIGELDDDWSGDRGEENGYWPEDLLLEGFIYTAIRAGNLAKAGDRLDWIRGSNRRKTRCQRRGESAADGTEAASLPTATGLTSPSGVAQVATPDPGRRAFARGPYRQLLRVYQQAGDDSAAREVAINERRDQRRLADLKLHRKLLNWLLDVTIGYGYRTWEALILAVGLYLLVLVVTLVALHHGAIMPVPEQIQGLTSVPEAGACRADYPCFSPFGYAFDSVVPIINIHQADYWRPDASKSWGLACAWISAVGTVVGWFLITLAVAGYTGLARRIDAP